MSSPDAPATLTISEVAAATGMTVRNIRAHQSRGLLPAPVRRGRRAYYGPVHLDRIGAIADLQRRGFNLVAIGAVLAEDGPGGGPAVPPAQRAEIERVVRTSAEDLVDGVVAICRRWAAGSAHDPAAVRRLVDLATPVATAALAARIRERAEGADSQEGVPPAAAM